ncbi:hypothetical protein MNEG_10358 [Monoraphidium neglectum]|uniref:EF-hand domain-containing protein n=1 Tax=Monoraphidium neglectum TaxID=145388 RepID=A0A0D2MSX7_9CHLO|nr:hypothetical protein MNEG_10358 [Monoraphidium neglectum]KIY97600.1 hypothetical protein MNEG_10358 [Monoraphidium neglectum]|eukprot:XP_013896620.1 hypothetical protein MNEG_10358 [Monoraphidium neglectum]
MFCRHLCSTSFAAVAGPGPSRPPPRAAVTAPSARRATIAVVPHSAGKGLVGGPAGGEGAVHPDPSQPLYPGFQEEKDVSHQAFLHAFEAARPRAMSIPGMQLACPAPRLREQQQQQQQREFAASIWNRRRSIPSQTYADPLDHIFNEARGWGGARSGGLLGLEHAFFHLGVFDTDSDGKLTAGEIAKALAARGVAATEAQGHGSSVQLPLTWGVLL